MASRTLKFKYEAYDEAVTHRRENLSYNKDKATIYYEVAEEQPKSAPSVPAVSSVPAPAPAPAVPAPAAPAPAAPAPSDQQITAEFLVHVIVAQKLKKGLGEIPISKSIKDLSAGKRFDFLFLCFVSITDRKSVV